MYTKKLLLLTLFFGCVLICQAQLQKVSYMVRKNAPYLLTLTGNVAWADQGETSVAYGTSYASLSLPSSINATYSSGSVQIVSTSWSAGSYSSTTPGYYDLLGTISDSNPYAVKARKRVFVKEQSGLAYLTASSNFYYDFTALTGSDGASISNGNAGLNDISVNTRTSTIVNTPLVNDLTVDGNTVKSLELTGNDGVSTGSNGNTFLNGDFEVRILFSTQDGVPSSTVSLLGGTQATPEGLHMFIDSSGKLNIFYGTTTSFNWRSTSALLADGVSALTLVRARIDFTNDLVTVWKNGQNTSGEFHNLIENTVAGSFSSGNITTVNPALYDCTSNIYIGTNNDAGTAYTNPVVNSITRASITPLLSNNQAAKVGEKFLDNFSYLHTSLRYSSTIDSYTNLYLRACFDKGTTRPLLVIVGSFNGDPNDFTDVTYKRLKDYGYFVLSVGMRGRMSASGSRDINARELYDVYDAIQTAKIVYGDLISTATPVFCGWSGGGGNAMAVAVKYPDQFKACISNFGISDYGWDATYGWYYESPVRQASLESSIGGSPTAYPNEYKTRTVVPYIASNLKSYLWLFHHFVDTNVPPNQSSRVKDVLLAASSTSYTWNESSGTPPLWVHTLPNSPEQIISAEAYWDQEAKALSAPTVALNGQLYIPGYIITDKFTIWLGNGTSAQDGKNRVALLSYNMKTNTYTVTPQFETGATDMTVLITTYDGRTASGTISAATTFNPN